MPDVMRFPGLEDQRVIYDVMRDHFFEMMEEEDEGIRSPRAIEETTFFIRVFEEAGFAPLPVEALSQVALHDATELHEVRKLTPEDFL